MDRSAKSVKRPWGVHIINDVVGVRCCQTGLPDGRWVRAIPEPYHGNRLVAAWWVLTGRAFALIWPKPGDLEDAMGPPPPANGGFDFRMNQAGFQQQRSREEQALPQYERDRRDRERDAVVQGAQQGGLGTQSPSGLRPGNTK